VLSIEHGFFYESRNKAVPFEISEVNMAATTKTQRRLAGRIAIVTGAGRGIGRAEAMLMALEGAKLVINDLGSGTDGGGADENVAQRVVDEIRAAGGTASPTMTASRRCGEEPISSRPRSIRSAASTS
jgi:NAD(P)-dependent dehydrogenase (short-subunit alcohol dehydrogenase family)